MLLLYYGLQFVISGLCLEGREDRKGAFSSAVLGPKLANP